MLLGKRYKEFKVRLWLVFCVVFFYSNLSLAAQPRFIKIKPLPDEEVHLSKADTFVLSTILRDLGLSLPDKIKVDVLPVPTPPPPKIDPTPSPPPAPPKTDTDDDFFDDDGFFDNDKGYDEIVKEMDSDYDRIVARWDAEYEATLKKWGIAREQLKKDLPQLLNATLQSRGVFESTQIKLETKSANEKSAQKSLSSMEAGDFHVIPNALSLPIRHQGNRGTCAAFAAIRAYEVLIAQYGIQVNFSEQHYYWEAKHSCKTKPCAKCKNKDCMPGAATEGMNIFQLEREEETLRTEIFVADEQACPYIVQSDDSNISQTESVGNLWKPRKCEINQSVSAGPAAIKPLGNNPNAIISELALNRPVAIGVGVPIDTQTLNTSDPKMDAELGSATGFVSLAKISRPLTPDGGHAMLAVGYIKLPPALKSEGRYCVITANSWAEGWGAGGYSCLSEAFLGELLWDAASLTEIKLSEDYLDRINVKKDIFL